MEQEEVLSILTVAELELIVTSLRFTADHCAGWDRGPEALSLADDIVLQVRAAIEHASTP